MDIVCMYCYAKYGEKPGSGTSHGCCPKAECQAKMRKDMGE